MTTKEQELLQSIFHSFSDHSSWYPEDHDEASELIHKLWDATIHIEPKIEVEPWIPSFETTLPRLKVAYDAWKEQEKEKNTFKEEFFALADMALKEQGLAIKVVKIDAPSEEIAIKRVKLHYPGWNIDPNAQPSCDRDGNYRVVIIEDPSLKSYSHEFDGIKYARTIRKGPVMIDDEWLKEADPELYEEVTFELPWGVQVPVPVDRLDKEILGRLTKYIYNGKPTVSLAAPKPVKAEE